LRNLRSGSQFRRDLRLAKKRGKDMAKLRELILLLS
jgi:mRNA-degrading endonuclease YafQ of YafQ-DinJ toxin-antitoxin module